MVVATAMAGAFNFQPEQSQQGRKSKKVVAMVVAVAVALKVAMAEEVAAVLAAAVGSAVAAFAVAKEAVAAVAVMVSVCIHKNNTKNMEKMPLHRVRDF